MCVPTIFLMSFRARLSLETLRAPGAVLLNRKATQLSDRVLHDLGVLGEALAVAAMPQLAHVLGHLVTLLKAHGHGVAQSHGCCSSMAALRFINSQSTLSGTPAPKTHCGISAWFFFQMFYSLYLFLKMASPRVAFMRMTKGHG